jgi:predicted dehydrogenase
MPDGQKRRVALAGTGHRGAGTCGRELIANCGDWVDIVGLCDSNPMRLERARVAIGIDARTFTNLSEMLGATRPDTRERLPALLP